MIKNYFSKKKSKWKAILLTLTILGTLFGIIMYVVISAGFTSYAILTQNKNNKIRTKTTRTYYTVNKYADEEPEIGGTTSATNGTGLNLMLINNIQTECYVKEMLELYRDSYEGKISTSEYHVGVETLLGIQVNETGTYPGTVLPKSYIPIKGTEIQWKKPYSDLPASAMTLRQINSNVIKNNLNGAVTGPTARLDYYINGINPDVSTAPGRDVNVFQVNHKSFGMFGGWVPKATIDGYKTDSSRVSDAMYLPDNLSYIDHEMSSIINTYGIDSSVSSDYKAMLYSINHNGGSGVLQYLAPFGVVIGRGSNYIQGINDSTRAEYKKSFDLMYEDFNKFSDVARKADLSDVVLQKTIGVIGLLESGWSINTTNTSYLFGLSKSRWITAYNMFFGGNNDWNTVRNYLNSKMQPIPLDNSIVNRVYGMDRNSVNGNNYTSLYKLHNATSNIYKSGDNRILQVLNVVNIGHITSCMYGGYKTYANMLKYAGVDVDPANPETYMNKYQGEWMPSGDLFWLKEAVPSIDINSVPKKVGEFLNFAKQFLGTPYVWGGRKPGGFDCSGYIQYCVQTHFGGTFGWTTVDQPGDPRVYEVSSDERRIGDFIYIGGAYASASHHVVIYLADAEPGFIWAMHAPQTGDVVKIGRYPTKEPFYYRRLKDYGS